MRARRGLAAVLMVGLVAGCSGGAEPAPAPAPGATPAPSSGPAPDRTAQVCTARDNLIGPVQQVDESARRGPVLPAAVALLLLAPRQSASAGGIDDPELAAALDELVAAIDDLDAQGRAVLPEGGNAAQDPVPLDTERVVAATEAVEEACAGI